MKNNVHFILLLALIFILFSCNSYSQAEADRAIKVFFLGVLEVANMLFIGIASVVFCVLSSTSAKQVFKVLGWIFLSIFFLFTAIIFIAVLDNSPKNPQIYFVFLIAFAMVMISVIFIFRKSKKSTQKKDDGVLDKIPEEII